MSEQATAAHDFGAGARGSLMSRYAIDVCRGVLLAPILACLGACGSLTQSIVSVDSAGASADSPVCRIHVDESRPVILHAVDRKPLPGIQVSNTLRSVTYHLHPGVHELWLSSAPYPFPFVPQRIKCFVLQAACSAGTGHRLWFDTVREVPVLSAGALTIDGVLVDQPLLLERGCRWR